MNAIAVRPHACCNVSGSMLRKASLIATLALVTWLPCASQSQPRAVSGVVTDKRGNSLPESVVQLENTVNLSVRSYITGKDGRYHFTGLSDDVDFTLKARYRNYWSESKTLSKFNSSAHPEVNLVIPVE
jgi:hypothetical protein